MLALALLEQMDPENRMMAQDLATVRSFLGDCAGAHAGMDQEMNSADPDTADTAELSETAVRLDALDAIVEAARNRQIVILNEAHHVPQHRAFALQLATRLRELGFTYLAIETLSPMTQGLAKQGYADRLSGFYSSEPVFGDFIRHSLRAGYRPIAYETMAIPLLIGDQTDRINHREQEQCKNLIKKVFSNDPQAKVFIYVGYSHATEDIKTLPDGREVAWMAARLKQKTGIDPLTIDQTIQTERGNSKSTSLAWRQAIERGWVKSPATFRTTEGSFFVGGSYAGKVDVQVFHPATELKQGRPDWLFKLPGRRAIAIPAQIAKTEKRVLVQAFLASESASAVPVDQVVVQPGAPAPVLVLPPGTFRLIEQDEAGNSTKKPDLIVADE